MKLQKSIFAIVAGALMLSLAGCATGPGEETARKEVDKDYVAAVERSARGLPLRVVWINPPTRETTKVEYPAIPPKED